MTLSYIINVSTVNMTSKGTRASCFSLISWPSSVFEKKKGLDRPITFTGVAGSNFEILARVQPPHWGFPGGSDSKESACSAGDPGLIPGLRRSPEAEHDNPL